MIIVKIILIIIIAYLLLVVGPALGGIISTTTRKNPKSLLKSDLSKGQYASVSAEITSDILFFENRTSEIVSCEARDHVMLKGYYYDNHSDKTVLMMHGYRALPLNNLASSGRFFFEEGYNVLMVVQRAHSISGGTFSSFGRNEEKDVYSWLQFLKEQKPSDEIVLFGASMGATTIAYALENLKDPSVKLAVLDCGYVSPHTQLLRDCKKRLMPYFLMLPIMDLYGKVVVKADFKIDARDALRKTTVPVFFMHGKKDRTVPYEDTVLNFEACQSDKELYLSEQAGHTMSVLMSGNELKEKLSSFLNKYL